MTSKKWQSGDKKNEEEIQSLYIFGYQCKIFRDDEKAMFIDQGKHLIPWMGDSSLMIDRYDGRGHIYDLNPYDADSVDRHHYDKTDRDRAVEKACDEERYLELHTDAVEQQVYEEEEMKRLYEAMGEGYSAVGFNYEQQPQLVQIPQKPEEEEEEEDEPYEVIPELQVPKGVNLPPTIKMHAIIEKTASFVAKQGPQMEIVVATKQSNNPQFKFLHYSHELNVYYKHIVRMIKKGKYTPKPQEEYQSKKKRRSSESADGQYLHPSLGGATSEEPEPLPVTSEQFLESVQSKLPSGQIANTAYAKLLSNLSRHRAESPVPSVAPIHQQTEPKEQTSKDAVVKNSKKPPDIFERKHSENILPKTNSRLPPVPGMDPVTLPGLNQPPPPGTVPPEPPLPHHHQLAPTGGVTQPSGTTGYEQSIPAHPTQTTTPPSRGQSSHEPYQPTSHESSSSYDHYSSANNYDYYHGYNNKNDRSQVPFSRYNSKNGNTATSHMREYNHSKVADHDENSMESNSKKFSADNSPIYQNEDSNSKMTLPSNVTLPSEHVQPIIDKMAQYVVRNGPEFEMMMKNKKDERFSFLQTWHELFNYYEYKKERFREEEEKNEEESTVEESEAGGDNLGSSKSVSFSIKSKDSEAPQIAPKRALLNDTDSSDDDGDRSSHRSDEKEQVFFAKREMGTSENSVEFEKKQAEESLKNKLALAARGKLAQAKEEEKVKAERKKKAARFAALLKTNTVSESSSNAPSPVIVSSVTSLGGNSPSASPVASTRSRASSVTKSPVIRNKSRSRTRSPSVVITKETYVSKSRSGTPLRKSRLKKSRSRSRDRKRSRSRSRSRSRRVKSSRRTRSRSPRRRKSKSPPLPSAYCVIRRSASPKSSQSSSVLKKPKPRSRSPSSRHKRSHRSRSRSPIASRSRRSRSRSRSKRSKRSRSKTKPSKSKKRVRSRDRKKSKKSSKKSKPKMIPIPELSPPPIVAKSSSNESDSDEDVIITDVEKGLNGTNHNVSELSRDGSAAATPGRSSDSEVTSSLPSVNILTKVRAMLKAQREELLKEDGEI